jgi:hypothetical protein
MSMSEQHREELATLGPIGSASWQAGWDEVERHSFAFGTDESSVLRNDWVADCMAANVGIWSVIGNIRSGYAPPYPLATSEHLYTQLNTSGTLYWLKDDPQ